MKLFFAAVLTLLAASGCASDDYRLYAESQAAIHTARANADAERYRAMASIAQSGDTTAKVAAMFAMQAAGNGGQQPAHIAAPKSTAEVARDWLGMILPVAIQGYGIHANSQVMMRQSDNSARVAESTNAAFVGIAGQIQAPAANVTTTTLSGSGVIGSGFYSAPTTTVTTLSGSGVLGSGSYTGPVSTTTLSGTGAIGGNYTPTTTTTDNHSVNNSNNPVTTYPVSK